MNPKRSFGSIGNPAVRPIEFPFLFCFRPARCRGKFNKSKPNIFGKPTQRISNVHSSSDRSTIIFSLFCKWICWFHIFSVYKTWRKRFRVDTYVLTFRSFEPWLRDSRWSNLCFLILYTGHNAFYILFWYIWSYYFLHIYWYSTLFIYTTAPFGFSCFFGIQRQRIYFILFTLYFSVLPLWLELFHMFVHSHVCIYYSPLFLVL